MSIRAYLEVGIFVLLALSFVLFVRHERALGAAHETAAVQQAAERTRVALSTAYASTVTQLTGQLNDSLKADAAANVSDVERLRVVTAVGDSGVARAAPASRGADGREKCKCGDDSRLERLGSVAQGLAAAGRDTLTALKACSAERDSLTGK
jgi:hypothetical protein